MSVMAQVKSPTSHHHGDLKEALIGYAIKAAQAGTLDDLSVRKASRDLGVSPGAAYRHFPDKDTLLRTIAQRGFDTLAADFEAIVPVGSQAKSGQEARKRFVALAQAYVSFARTHYGLWRLMFGPHGLLPHQQPDRPPTYSWLEKSLAELAEFEVTGPADEEARFFAWTTIHGLSDLQASPAIKGEAGKGVVERQCTFVISALSSSN